MVKDDIMQSDPYYEDDELISWLADPYARYVLLMRARTISARPRVIARATSGIRFR